MRGSAGSALPPFLLLLAAIAYPWAPIAAAAKSPNCTGAQAKSADKWLWLNARDKELSLKQNLPWGAPTPTQPETNEQMLIHWDYVIDYDDDLEVPLWTGERVVGAKLGNTTRSDCFRADPRLAAAIASTPADYDEPIFDQGHVTPSADVTISRISVWNSFIMSNMTPQYARFNRGIWRQLEEYVRRWAISAGTAWITTGSLFDRDSDGRRDPDQNAVLMKPKHGTARVAVPTAFYKIIAVEEPSGRLKTLAFILPNDPAGVPPEDTLSYLQSKIVHLDAIEQLAGIHLFPAASGIDQSEELWPIPKPSRSKPAKRGRARSHSSKQHS